MDKHSAAAAWLRGLAKEHIPSTPKAIVVISAHWDDSSIIKITSNPKPSMFYDYYGFPDYTYKIEYPAVVDVILAKRVHSLLSENNIAVEFDEKRGWDHGVFVPLKLIYPDAQIPLVQISLRSDMDPALHYRIGELLAPLRKEGIMIFGSGYAIHNLRERAIFMGGQLPQPMADFLTWLDATVAAPTKAERKERFIKWEQAPGARRSHPR